MGRYVRKYTRIGSIGPTEERGFALWAGYDIVGVDRDLSAHGLVNVDGWPQDRIAELGVTVFTRVAPEDTALYRRLGIEKE